MKHIKTFCILSITVLSALFFAACSSKKVPTLLEVSKYSYEQLAALEKTLDEKTSVKNWGEPREIKGERIWTLPIDDGCKYISTTFENGAMSSLRVSQPLYVTVAVVRDTEAYGLVSFDSYTKEPSALTLLPSKDLFSNEIKYALGDLYYFEFNGEILETYPAQIFSPYSATLMGHLSEEETAELRQKVKEAFPMEQEDPSQDPSESETDPSDDVPTESTTELGALTNIVDRSETEGLMTACVLEQFYEDEKYVYFFPSAKSSLVECYFESGCIMIFPEALKKGAVTIKDLDKFNIQYYAQEKE